MDIEFSLEEVERLSRVGRYKLACKMCEKLLNEVEDLEDKNDIEKELDKNRNYLSEFFNLETGEAIFPVVDSKIDSGYLRIIKVFENNNSNQTKDNFLQDHFEIVKKSVAIALKEFLKEKNVLILDCNFDKYSVCIKKLPNEEDSENVHNETIKGNSLRLAMAVALLSKLLNHKIDSNYIFTGNVENNTIRKIDFLDEKINLIKEYTEEFNLFIPNENKNQVSEEKIIAFGNLEQIINLLFNNEIINKFIQNYFFTKKDINNFTFFAFRYYNVYGQIKNINDSTNFPTDRFLLIEFCFPQLKPHHFNRVLNFLDNLKEIISDKQSGVIFSGPLPLPIASGMVVNLKNNFSRFLALHYTHEIEHNEIYDQTAIVFAVSQGSGLERGQLVFYKREPAE